VRELTATLIWFGDEPGRAGAGSRYLVKHTTRSVPARLDAIEHRLDVTTLADEPADQLELNEIGRVRLRLGSPLVADPYEQVRATGAFIVVDSATNDTVGAGMIR
jgi:sulfate adenylyltransferase subunit 1 (EFTu-like GTPase family)